MHLSDPPTSISPVDPASNDVDDEGSYANASTSLSASLPATHDTDSDSADTVILALCCRNNKMGAAAFNIETASLYLLEDMNHDPEFEDAKTGESVDNRRL
eukprot:jgi/Hompol1/6627/HPOL_002898-RA